MKIFKHLAMVKVMLGIVAMAPLVLTAPAANALETYPKDTCIFQSVSRHAVFGGVVRILTCPIYVPSDFLSVGTKALEVSVKSNCLRTTRTVRVLLEYNNFPLLVASMTVGAAGGTGLWILPRGSSMSVVVPMAVQFPSEEISENCLSSVKLYRF